MTRPSALFIGAIAVLSLQSAAGELDHSVPDATPHAGRYCVHVRGWILEAGREHGSFALIGIQDATDAFPLREVRGLLVVDSPPRAFHIQGAYTGWIHPGQGASISLEIPGQGTMRLRLSDGDPAAVPSAKVTSFGSSGGQGNHDSWMAMTAFTVPRPAHIVKGTLGERTLVAVHPNASPGTPEDALLAASCTGFTVNSL